MPAVRLKDIGESVLLEFPAETIPRIEVFVAELIALIYCLVIGGARLILHEWDALSTTWRRIQIRHKAKKILPQFQPLDVSDS